MNILPPSTRARREGLDGVAGLFMRDRARHQGAGAETPGRAQRHTHLRPDAFATRGAAPLVQAGESGSIAIPAPCRGTAPIQSP
jgi:hypothetical protein